eukprot:Lithocolla_globosa_v1_NODE_1411_length_2599_cov_8.375786.p1 type:complete len:219 gc:universal NODE_1411_length_2599_cov_8.375786:2081-1425(-)
MGDGEIKQLMYKIIVVGDIGTGKTSLIMRYVNNAFTMHYKSTIGVDFALKTLNWSSDTVIRLQLWDIAGQERYGNMTRVYYKGAAGALLVFDVTRPSTLAACTKWKKDIDDKVMLPNQDPIPVLLLANKCDLAKEGPVMNPGQIDKICQDNGFIGWFETSAKTDTNIDRACRFLTSKILQNDPSPDEESSRAGRVEVLTLEDEVRKNNQNCCIFTREI